MPRVVLGDRNLLFGTLAVQLRLATPQQLATAASVWAADPQRQLADILVELGTLRPHDRQLIEQLIYRQQEATGGDASQLLEAYGGAQAVHESFGAVLTPLATPDSAYASLGTPTAADSMGGARAPGDSSGLTPETPGRYKLEAEQGRGGVGRVLIAYDQHIERQVALKELLPRDAHGAAASASPHRLSAAHRERFLREARITGQLEHPGIVPVHELGQRADGTAYYTMKLVRGATLAARLAACSGLADRLRLLPHFVDVCQAIAYAHARGVVHRDIKPANVMVGQFGETVILDWGLAKVRGQADVEAGALADEVRLLKAGDAGSSVAGTPIGTPSYMPPEQADGRIADIDERSDVWSLGAVLYEVLTGQPPFTGASAYEVVGAVLTDPVVPVRERCPDMPPELAAICQRCLERDPARRYQRVDELAADVEAFQTGGLVSAYTYSTGLILRRWAARRWPALATAGVALLLLALLGGVSYGQVLKQRNAAVAANTRLDRKNNELLGLKLAYESHTQLGLGQTERAVLLAVQAARYFGRSSRWMPEIDAALREVLSSRELSRVLLGHSSAVRGISFSPDDLWLASGSFGTVGDVRLWDLRTPGAAPRVLAGSAPVAFSPDGKLLACGVYGAVGQPSSFEIFDLSQPKAPPQRFAQSQRAPSCLAFSPAGQWLATANQNVNGDVQLWHVGQLSQPALTLPGAGAIALSLAFSTDGRRLAIGYARPVIHIVSLEDPAGTPIELQGGHTSQIYGVVFSRDGTQLYSASRDGTVLEWELGATSGSVRRKLFGGEDFAMAVALRPDGRQLATVTYDNKSVWLIDLVGDPTPRLLRGHTNPPWVAAYSYDGKTLATAGEDNTVRLWDLAVADPEPVSIPSSQTTSAMLTRDCSTLICGGAEPALESIDLEHAAKAETIPGPGGIVRRLALSPDEKYLAVASNKELLVWNWPASSPPRRLDCRHTVRAVAFAPGDRLVVGLELPGDQPYALAIYDASDLTRPPQAIPATGPPYALFVSPDGRLLVSADGDAGATIWQLADLSQRWRRYKLDEPLVAGAFSADSRFLALGGWDNKVHVWDLGPETTADTPEKYVLSGHESWVQCVAFSPDGRRLASGSRDNTIRLWNLAQAGTRPEILTGHKDAVRFVSFLPGGQRLISAGLDGRVCLWDLEAGDLVRRASARPWRNLSLDEWHDLVGADIPYERTLPQLPDGPGVGAPPGKPLQ